MYVLPRSSKQNGIYTANVTILIKNSKYHALLTGSLAGGSSRYGGKGVTIRAVVFRLCGYPPRSATSLQLPTDTHILRGILLPRKLFVSYEALSGYEEIDRYL